MARPKDKEEIILQAALEAFMNKGFPNTSIKDIAQIAGIAKGTIYDYFTSKDDLFIEAINYQKQIFSDLIVKNVFNQGSFSDAIGSAMDLIISSEARQHTQLMDMIFMAIPALKPEPKMRLQDLLGNMRREGVEVWKNILRMGFEEGKSSMIDLDFAAACAFCLTSAYNAYLSDLADIQYDQEKKSLIKFILNGIGYKDRK
ncbi:MAG: TetR/AcrR family transcriptional regulator [Syntrophomonas sp.]